MSRLLIFSFPIFAASILIELAVSWLRRDGRYRLNDAISSLGVGIFGTTTGIFANAIGLYVYSLAFERLALWRVGTGAAGLFAAAFVYDFFYYWSHRAHHRISILWAAHTTHHSSEDLNFSTALRQSATQCFSGWIVFLPMAVLGFPLESYVFGGAVSVLYGFFTHTQYIPSLGWYERIFVGASGHRVHHGRNGTYIDKNYGSILMIWDRLFGTYQAEIPGVPIEYGVVHPIRTLNPLAISLRPYQQLWERSKRYRGRDRIKALFAPPDWEPSGAAPVRAEKSGRFDPELAPPRFLFCCLQFAAVAAGTALMMVLPKTDRLALLASCLVLWSALDSIGRFLDDESSAVRAELLRELILAIALALCLRMGGALAGPVGVGLLGYVFCSFACLMIAAAFERSALRIDKPGP